MSETFNSVLDLSPEERELFELLLSEEGVQTPREEPIRRRSPGEPVPLSFGQQRLWFLDRLEPGQPTYNLFFAVAVAGDLRPAVLRWALQAIEHRHEILRTTFALVGDRPLQQVAAPGPFPLPGVDLSALTEDRCAGEASRLAREEARRPFDLKRGPLWRAILLLERSGQQVLLLAMHHTVSDGWSHGILIQELATLYAAAVEGRMAPPWAELPVQYGDFAIWQRKRAEDGAFARNLEHWCERLAGFSPLDLPCDRPRNRLKLRGGRLDFLLPDAPVRALQSLVERESATPFMGFLAVFKALLARYTGEEELVIGSPSAGRTRVELEPLIGFFVNNLVLRTDLSRAPGLRELLRRVREVSLDAFAHEELPFEHLVEAMKVERAANRSPFFQVVFAFQDGLDRAATLPGLTISPRWIEMGTAKFDLTLSIAKGESGTVASIEFDRDLFDPTTIHRVAAHLRGLLAAMVEAPERSFTELPYLSAAERHQLVVEPRPTPYDDTALCLHDLFRYQAARTPGAVALSLAGRHMTYGELDRRSDRLASRLRRLGAEPESLVALRLERSFDLVVAILGVLKTGAAYVPLDLSWPMERLSFVLADIETTVILTDAQRREELPQEHAAMALVVAGDELPDVVDEGGAVAVDPQSTAYVIYTSGSTGKPKGVAVSHANAVRLFTSTEPWFRFGADDVWTLFHSVAFDFSVWELWGALLYGGRLVIVPYLTSRSPADLHTLLAAEGVTILNATPSAFRGLVRANESAPGSDGLALRTVVFGGEALDPHILEGWFQRHGDRRPRLVNMYGITETTVHVTYRPMSAADVAVAGSPLGEAIPDLAVYVLDRYGMPQPLGTPGEICVAGAGLARGYFRRPGLTAERFVPAPWGDRPGNRLYRSGDLARRLPGGGFEYLGRIDNQVKIRGFRIELGEIEAALRECVGIREGMVVARQEGSGDSRLVAYLVPAGPVAPNPEELRRALGRRLPESMVPVAYVFLPALPLTVNGKLDRRALPEPSELRPELAQPYVEPTTPVEEALALIWAQVLRVERVGVHDNFFALGGDSILSVQVAALAQQRGLQLSVAALFQHQVVAELAPHVTGGPAAALAARSEPFSLVAAADRPRLPADIEDAYPLSCLQAGMLYHMQRTPDCPLYHNVNSFHLRARWDERAFAQALAHVVARHPVLRTSFDLLSYSEPLQLVHRAAAFPLVVEDLRGWAPEEQEKALDGLVGLEKQRVFDLSRPPLLRFHVHLRSADTFQLMLTECHAILDGWSLQSTLAEIFSVYRGAPRRRLSAGGAAPGELVPGIHPARAPRACLG